MNAFPHPPPAMPPLSPSRSSVLTARAALLVIFLACIGPGSGLGSDTQTAGEVSPPSVPETPDTRLSPPVPLEVMDRLRDQYAKAREHHETHPSDWAAAWRLGRAAFQYAELALPNRERAEVAEVGMAASRKALVLDPDRAEGHYYLALNTGQLARTRGLSALRLVRDMEGSLIRARDLDPELDFSGPDRILGQLYLDCPGWPTSIGSRSKAQQHLEQAVQRHPDHPSNRLFLIEAWVRWRQYATAGAMLDSLEEQWDALRQQWDGPEWEDDWPDWETQRSHLRSRLDRNQPRSRGR